MNTVATSTVAMTAYNLLAGSGGGRTRRELAVAVQSWATSSGITLHAEQLNAAIQELASRKLVSEALGLLDVRDPLRRLVIERDRSDVGWENPGWRGWKVHAARQSAAALVELSEVLP